MARVNHLGIIVDGNGRWAQKRGKNRSEGHKAGAEALKEIILYISEENIANYLSLYVFSTENFNRSKEEVDYLMDLFMKWFNKVSKEYKNANIKVLFSKNDSFLENKVLDSIKILEEETKDNTGLVVNFCLSYGGRQEIVDATKSIASKLKDGIIELSDINEELFSDNLYQKLPDIDFLIRTSGENRISNFMLWQISYAEFYFPDTYFPDFTPKLLDKALDEFDKRDRRFGKIKK